MNNCINCRFTEFQCKILLKLKNYNNDFHIGNKFIEYKDFCCNQWQEGKIRNENKDSK